MEKEAHKVEVLRVQESGSADPERILRLGSGQPPWAPGGRRQFKTEENQETLIKEVR